MEFKIAIIGTGNVAWHLGEAFENAGHTITEVYGRTLAKANSISERLYATVPLKELDFSESEAEVFVMAVSDEAIPDFADAVILPEKAILVHTSGSVSLDVLAYSSAQYTGIFYPLQSFSKHRKMDISDVPILLESDDREVMKRLKQLAKTLSPFCYEVNSKDRLAIHVAAVFASNFTNHMVRIAEEVMHRQGLDVEMLKPLLIEQVSKCLDMGARQAQTGPAARGDISTLESHHQFLSYNEGFAEIYRVVSQDIMDSF